MKKPSITHNKAGDLRCSVHPHYKHIRRPNTGCSACWALWYLLEEDPADLLNSNIREIVLDVISSER